MFFAEKTYNIKHAILTQKNIKRKTHKKTTLKNKKTKSNKIKKAGTEVADKPTFHRETAFFAKRFLRLRSAKRVVSNPVKD